MVVASFDNVFSEPGCIPSTWFTMFMYPVQVTIRFVPQGKISDLDSAASCVNIALQTFFPVIFSLVVDTFSVYIRLSEEHGYW